MTGGVGRGRPATTGGGGAGGGAGGVGRGRAAAMGGRAAGGGAGGGTCSFGEGGGLGSGARCTDSEPFPSPCLISSGDGGCSSSVGSHCHNTAACMSSDSANATQMAGMVTPSGLSREMASPSLNDYSNGIIVGGKMDGARF